MTSTLPRSTRVQTFRAFWGKINNDWIFNLSGLLAYNFLLTLFPLLLLLLGSVGFFLGSLSPTAQQQLQDSIIQFLGPGVGFDTASALVKAITDNLRQSVTLLVVVGLISAFFAGTRLLIVLENCFSVIFRAPSRRLLQQNLMAIAMLLLYLILIALLALISLVPLTVFGVSPDTEHDLNVIFLPLGRYLASLIGIFLVVALLYAFVPSQPPARYSWRTFWRGVVVATGMIWLFELLFPLYQRFFLRGDNYGSVGAFLVVVLIFFYYLGLILLLGAELNSFASGYQKTSKDLPGLLHDLDEQDRAV